MRLGLTVVSLLICNSCFSVVCACSYSFLIGIGWLKSAWRGWFGKKIDGLRVGNLIVFWFWLEVGESLYERLKKICS